MYWEIITFIAVKYPTSLGLDCFIKKMSKSGVFFVFFVTGCILYLGMLHKGFNWASVCTFGQLFSDARNSLHHKSVSMEEVERIKN